MKGKIFMGALASLSLFLIASACDIGLGGAVDTEIPTGTISSPGVNAVIRDAFAIKGTWKDDGSVGQVTVALSNTNTKKTLTYNAKVAADGTWICAVDPADSAQPLVDGTYLATVTLYDNGGHTNTVTQSYIIDNTPPVVILSYLKSKDDSATEIKTYGKLFTLSGKAADDNNINRIDVKVYQDEACSTELRTITKQNVPAAIEQDVASFGTEEYSAIYGENSTNSQVRYCKVFAYDDAQRYPADGSAQTDSDKLGNCQTSYYFQTTIEKLGYDKYKTNDLYAMFNGTYSNGSQDSSRAVLTSDEISTVKKTLTETAVKVGTFALNPKNNPTFTVIGLNNYLPENQSMNNAQNKPDEKYYVTNGSGENGIPLTITLTPGRDNYAIDEATVKMYLQECDDKGIANGKKISLASNVTSFKTKTLSTFNYTALDTGSFYKVCVEGSDTKGNSLEADVSGIYAFYFAPDTKTLELFVTGSPEYISSQTASKDLTLTLTYSYNGTASNPLHLFRKYQTDFTNEELKTLREQIKENPDNNGVIAARNTEIENLVNKYIVKNASGTPKELEIGTNKKFTDTFDAAATVDGTANKDKTYVSYFIMSDDKASYSNTKDYYIHVDDAKPALTVTAYPSPVQTSDNSFWFEGTSNDGDGSGVSKVLIKIKDESVSPAKETDWLEASGTSAWKFTIIKDSNFSNTDNPSYNGVFLKEGKKTVIVKAIDIVGLESEEVTKADWIYKPSKPKIGIYGYYLSEADVNDTTKRVEKRESDLISNSFDFAVGKKIILSGFATDTYGIDSITVTENDKKTSTVILNKDVTGSYIGTWQTELFPISELPAAGSTATYTYKFTIKDLAGIETPSKELKITVDLTPPVVDITSLGTGKFGESSISGSDVIFRGTASDPTPGTGLDVIKYAITSIDETNPSVWNTTNPDGNDWSITKVLKENQGTDSETDLYEGKKRLHVKAIDKAGNETKPHTIRDFCVDQKAPDVEVKVYRGSVSTPETAQQDGTYKITQEVSNFHITVTAKDANFIKKITVNDGSTITNEILAGNDLTYTWSSSDYNIEKTYNFEITVEDGSGNDTIAGKKTTKNVTVLFDKTKPEIKVMNGENEADTVKTAKLYWFSGTGNAYITGTAKDDQSGIDKMEIQIDSEGWNIIPTTDKWTYQYLLNGITENTDDDDSYHTIKVRITDKAGNTNNDEGQIYYFRYDKGAPKLTMFTSADSVNNEGKVIFSGQVYDGDSLEANRPVNYLTLEGKKAGSPDKIIPVVPNQDYTYHGNYTVTVDGFYLDEGDWNFVLTAEDYAGNEVTKEAVISVDKTPPTVKKVEADVVILPSSDNSVTDSLNKWYNKQTLSVIVSAEDNTAGSGIDKVEWRTAAIDSTATDETADWQPLTKKTEAGVITYNGSVVFDDAAAKEGSRLYIRAIDKAGNSTKFNTKVSSTDPNSAIDYIVFNIDTEKPTLTSKFYQVEGGSRKTSGGTIYLAENKRITVYGAFSDEQSGVQKLSYSLGGRDITSSVTTTYYSSDETLSEDKISTIFVDANKTTDKKSIKYWKAEFTPVLADNTNVDLVITGKDFADNESKIAPVFSMLKDTEEPVIDRKNVTFTITGNDEPVYMKGNKGETGEKYYVNNITQTFTLHGIATDNVGLDSVELKAKDSSGNEITIDSKKSGSASNWTFSDIDLSKTKAVEETASVSLTGGVTLYVELTDLAGNKNIALNQKITVVFDTEAPRGKHLADGKGKDIYFRIGNTNNDDILETDSLWDAALDVNVGSKYSAETYGNTKNIEIRGLFDDGDVLGTADVSGLKTIYYKVYKKSEHKAEFDKVEGKTYKELVEANKNFASDIKTSYTGKITPDSSITEKRVFYTDTSKTSAGSTLDGKLTSEGYITDKDGNPKHWAKIKSNFDQTITGFDEENNYLVLVAEDNVGNIAVDLVLLNEDATTHKGDSYNNFSLNVDTNPPVSGDFVSSATYTNATTGTQATKLRNGDIVITGTVKDVLPNTTVPADSVSELKSLIVKVGNTDNKIEFKIKEEEENSTVVKNYYVNDVKQAVVPAADVDFDSDTYKDKPNILTTNKNSSDNLAVRKWKATISGSYFAGLSGNVVIYAIGKDNAGNEKSVTAANVIVDSVKPAVTLNLTENTTVNGKQTLKGTISDSYLTEDPAGASEPGTLELFYTTKAGTTAAPDSIDSTAAATANAGTDWRKYGTTKHASSFEFKDIDTAKLILSGGTDSTTYIPDQTKVYFTVKATDKAGNIGFSTPKSFTVDQDTDRPVITIKNLPLESMTSAGIWAKDNLLFGTVTDDDGVSEVYVMRKNADDEEPSASDDGWGNNLLEGGIWQYTIPKDGYGVFYFKVVDTQNPAKTYISSATKVLQTTPKIYDKQTTPNQYGIRGETTDSRVYLKVDTTKPKIRNVFYRLSDSTTTITVTESELSEMLTNSTKPAGWESLTSVGLGYIGGTSSSRCLWILYDFWDENGVKEIETEQIKREDKTVNGVSSTTFTSTENSNPTYRLIKFDLSTLNSGDNKLSLMVKDQADSSSEPKEYTVKIDNTAPGVDIRNPQEGSDEYGSLSVSASGSVSDEHINNRDINNIPGLYFAITKDETKPDVTSTDWTNIKDCVTGTGRWNILFDKDNDTDLGLADDGFYHVKKLNEYLKVLYPSDFTGTEDIHKDLYFWVYAVDSLGNSNYSSADKRKITVYTQADKPDLAIEYPDSTATTLAGMIRISGSAEIRAEKVASVWLKIDPEYNGTSFNDSGWETKLTALNSAYTVEDSGNSIIGRAVKADGTTSWHYTINSKNEFGKIDDENRKVAVKAYALSSTNKASELRTVSFTINPDKPQIKSAGDSDENVLILVNKADPTKKMQYEENMWISGEWYLEGSVRHGAGIYLFTYTEAGEEGIDLINTNTFERTGLGNITLTERSDAMDAGATAKNWDFSIPVGASGDSVGTNEFTIRIQDNGSKASETKTIKLRYDNKAPNSFVARTSNGVISSTNKNFRNSNGQFALNGTINENESAGESGVKRIAFYFTRAAKAASNSTTKTTYFIDPLITKVSSATTEPDKYRNNYVDVSSTGISYSDPENGGDGLYWGEVSVDSVSDKVITVSSIPEAFSKNVRKGGLCKMNSAVYTIKEKVTENGKIKITLDSAPASAEKAYFALAQVIDNTSIETGRTDLFTETDTLVNQDGDCMQEGLTGTGGNYEWQATINSTNLYDGPVTLHFVYYDKAGNSKAETIAGMICNNAPRIASVAVKSDYNGNESFEEETVNEILRYYPGGSKLVDNVRKALKAVSGTVIVSSDNTTSGSAFMTLKDKSAIDVEMVGGNGKLHYEYAIGDTAGADGIKSGQVENWADGIENNYDETSDYVVTTHTHTIDLPVSFFTEGTKVPNNTRTKPVTWFQYKIWDDTDGTEKFVDSQNVTVQIALDVQVTDDIKPNVVIDPFKWISSSNNSLYQNSNKNGHIELEDDWKNATGYSSTATDGEYDSDPKVSGKIVLRGYAYDNKRLSNIQISIPKSTVLSTATTVAMYDNKNKTWKDSDTTGDVEGLTKGTMKDNGWHFIVSNSTTDGAYFDDKGHKIMWTFEYDSEKVTGIATNDVVVTLTANDSASNPSTGREENTTSTATDVNKHKPAYKMDVVPYITGIKTDLSVGKNQNSWTTLSRSALGIYPVSRGSNITVEGFNLNGTSSKVMIGSEEYTPNSEGTTTNNLVITTNAATTSAGLVAKTGSVESLNNRTVKTVAYNQEPNNRNNNILTDARELHIVDVYTTTNTEDKRNLDMAIYGNDINFSAGYKDSYFSIMMGADDTSIGTISNLRNSYTRYFDNAIAINEDGTPFTVSACGDTLGTPVESWGNGPSQFALTKGTSGPSWEYSQISDNISLLVLDSNWNGANLNNLNRFQWPSIIVRGHDSETKGYISYYDTTQKLVKFRYFISTDEKLASNLVSYRAGSKASQFVEGAVNTNDTYSQGYTAIAGANENSPYSVVGVDKDGNAIVAWYDSTSGALKMKYNTSPAASFSGYQEFTSIPTGQGYVATGNTYNFIYNSAHSSFYATDINGNQGGKYVKIGNEYYELEYKDRYWVSSGWSSKNYYHYEIKNYGGTSNINNIEVYTLEATSISGQFNISVDGGTSQLVEIAASLPERGDKEHEFAYQLNLLLSKNYGAYAEVDPKTNKVTVRSMQTGTNSSISITGITNGGAVSEAVAGSGEPWHEVTVDNDSSGQYVAMKTDSKGGIHFAYYDTGNGDLKYAYMSSVTATPVVVTVDGYQQVGQYVDLAIREGESVDGTSCIVPYISYYSMSNGDTNRAAKVAKLAKPLIPVTGNATITSANASGVDDDGELFTGNWEVFHVPTNGKPDQYRVNIGVTSSGNVYVSYLADRIIEYVKVY